MSSGLQVYMLPSFEYFLLGLRCRVNKLKLKITKLIPSCLKYNL